MTSALDIESLLSECGAHRGGHFLLSSGRHSSDYVQCALLLEHPRRARRVGRALAEELRPFDLASVAAPALGGLIIGYEVACALDLPFRFAERREGVMAVGRGFGFEEGERVAVVEDVVTTGRSTLETVAVIEEKGAEVVAIATIIDRTAGREPFGVPFKSLIRLELESFEPTSCPACREGRPVEKPGSRTEPVGPSA